MYLICTFVIISQTLLNFQHLYCLVSCWMMIFATLVQFQVKNGIAHSVTDIFIVMGLTFCSLVHRKTRKETYINMQERLHSERETLRLKGETQRMELRVTDMRCVTCSLARHLTHLQLAD
jgi:hypothetical protein